MRILTDWFPATNKPVRAGEYLTRFSPADHMPLMLIWNGTSWMSSSGYGYSRLFQWRGLAFDPAAAEECADAESPDPTNPRRGWWVPQP